MSTKAERYAERALLENRSLEMLTGLVLVAKSALKEMIARAHDAGAAEVSADVYAEGLTTGQTLAKSARLRGSVSDPFSEAWCVEIALLNAINAINEPDLIADNFVGRLDLTPWQLLRATRTGIKCIRRVLGAEPEEPSGPVTRAEIDAMTKRLRTVGTSYGGGVAGRVAEAATRLDFVSQAMASAEDGGRL